MSKKEEVVSVIVPIYNRESLMQKCVDSILNQTYKNIEVLLVDDHSSDNSYKVMKEFSKKDSRVKAYTYKENKGAGHARNVGLDNATGDYIIFVDSDDYIDNDYVETLVNHIGDADMICCGYKNINENGSVIKINKVKNNSYGMFRYPVIWARMYTLSSINENKTRFSDIKTRHDIRFLFEYMANVGITNVCDYQGYNNVLTGDNQISVNENYIKKRRIDRIFENIEILLKRDNYKFKYKNEVYYFVIKDMLLNVLTISKYLSYEELKKYNKEANEFILDSFSRNDIKIHFTKKYDTLVNWFAVNIYTIFLKLHIVNAFLLFINLMH